MARGRRRGDDLHGLVVVDKPAGVSSGWVVDELRRRLGQRGVGHTGTLDPAASGVLPCVLGQATKLAGYLLADEKAYRATIACGVTTATDDAEGAPIGGDPAAAARLELGAVRAALEARLGRQWQTPPVFSAIKVEGRRLYQRALDGEPVQPAAREITIDRLTLVEFAPPRLIVDVACSKGTFVRALARDLGAALGCGAHLAALERTRHGRFTTADAHPIAAVHRSSIGGLLIPLAEVCDLPQVRVDDATARDVEHGRRVPPPGGAGWDGPAQLVTTDGWVIAIARVAGPLLAYDRVLRRPGFGAPAPAPLGP